MNRKYQLIIGIVLLNVIFFCVMTLFNLYILGGIDFPNEAVNAPYGFILGGLIYGGGILMPIISAGLVAKRDIGYKKIVLLNAIPYIAQAIAFALYLIFGNLYGYICC